MGEPRRHLYGCREVWSGLIARVIFPLTKKEKPDVIRLEAGNRLSVNERVKETRLKNIGRGE